MFSMFTTVCLVFSPGPVLCSQYILCNKERKPQFSNNLGEKAQNLLQIQNKMVSMFGHTCRFASTSKNAFMPHCVPGFYSKLPGSTWVVPRGPLYTCLYQSNKAILSWYFSTSLFLLHNLWAKDWEDGNNLKISDIGYNYIVIYFIFKCHLKGMLSWVNFVEWHNFLTLQTLFPICSHTLVPSCMSENTDIIVYFWLSLYHLSFPS